MGVGKTTLGKSLAKHMGYQFIDTDREIEASQDRKISDIFASDGETFFRELEAKWCQQNLPKHHNAIIATGGGLITQEANRQALANAGFIVWLHAPLDWLAKRTSQSKKRPLLNTPEDAKQVLDDLFSKRKAHYKELANLQLLTNQSNIPKLITKIQSAYQVNQTT